MYVRRKKYTKSVIFIDIGQFRGGNFVLFFLFSIGLGADLRGKRVFCADVLFFWLLFLIV